MEITKREDVTKQGFCKLPLLWRKLRLRGSLFIISVLIQFQSHCHPSGWGEGGRLFEAGRLLTFSAFRMGPYSRWALIRGWALFRINTVVVWWFRQVYRKIPKISPGASIFQRPYLRGLFLEVLLFGRAYLRRRSWKEIYRFCLVLLCIWGQFPSTSPWGGLYLEGRFHGGFFVLWGRVAYTWRGLFSEFYGSSKTWKIWLNIFKLQPISILVIRCNSRHQTFSDHFTFLWNCPPTPPLNQHKHLVLT